MSDDYRGGPWVFDGRLTVYQQDEGTPDVCVVADDDCAEANAMAITQVPELISIAREWRAEIGTCFFPGSLRAKQAERIDAVLALAVGPSQPASGE